MSNRQIRKLQQRAEDSHSEQEYEEPNKPTFNAFSDVSEQESSEDLQHHESAAQIRPPQKPAPVCENLDELLQDLKQEEDLPAPQVVSRLATLKRSINNFDPATELKRLFKEESKQSKSRKSNPRLCLTPEMASWDVKANYLVAMERVPDPASSIFFFNTTNNYNKVSPEYIEAIESNDPNSLMEFLNRYPFHIEALFQVCMYYQLQGNYEQVGVFIDRALYSFQRSFHHQFSPIGNNLLNIEFNDLNKIFHRCLFMQVELLGRRGCPRTALEHLKFLLSLAPTEDPLGCLLQIDYYSIRSKQYEFLMQFVRGYFLEYYGYGLAFCLPHLMYSTALCKAMSGEIGQIQKVQVETLEDLLEEEASVILLYATKMFPAIGLALQAKLTNSPDEAEGECAYGDLKKVSLVYATRNIELWKDFRYSNWLKECLSTEFECEIQTDERFAGIYNRYSGLVPQNFSFDVQTAIPEDLNVGRPERVEGNLDPHRHPLYLYFATLLPWNNVSFAM